MHKISRILVANAGVPDAWYDGQLIPFTDIATDEPTHTVYNLTNGGGKTTIMSLIFSTIDTEKSRFLQTLGNSKKRFDEYFDQTGLPGFVVIEWAIPGDTQTPVRHLVTGQIVLIRGSGDATEADRHFFSFRSNDRLSLDTLPMPGTGNTPLRSREEVLKWLEATEQSNRGNFQKFVQQNSWKENLVSKGIDVDMFRQQVEMNRNEGQQDSTLLHFRNETDFVHKFLAGTLNNTNADETRAVVAELCRKVASRKELKDKLDQMDRLTEKFEPFCAAAVLLSASMDRLDSLYVNAAQTAVTLRGRETALRTEAAINTARAADERYRGAQYEAAARAHAASAEFLDLTRKQRVFHTADVAASESVEAAKVAAKRLDLIAAAEATAEIQQIEEKLVALRELIDTTNERDIRPLREAAGRTAALYKAVLEQASQAQGEALVRHKSQIEALREAATDLQRIKSELRLERDTHVTELAGVRTHLDKARSTLAALAKAGTILDTESPVDAQNRLIALEAKLDATRENREADELAAEKALRQAVAQGVTATGAKTQSEQKARELTRTIRQAQALREELADHAAIQKAWAGREKPDSFGQTIDDDSSIVNIDASNLRELLAEQIERLYVAARGAARELEDLAQAKRDLRETRLAARDSNVSAVVDALKLANIPGAMAYADYLANVLPDATAARRLVLSDPARYLGVAIASARDLEAAQQATTSLKLTRPITISAYSNAEPDTHDERYVVGPADNAAFNHDEARQKADALEQSLAQADSAAQQTRYAHEEAQRIADRLDSYLSQFGEGRLADMQARLEESEARIAEQEAEIARYRDAEALAKVNQSHARAQAKDLTAALKETSNRLRDVERYMQDYADVASGEARAERLLVDIEAVDGKLEDCAGRQELGATQLAQHERDRLNGAHEMSRLAKTIAQLTDVDTSFDAAAELARHPHTEAAASLAHDNARSMLDAAENGTARELKYRCNETERELKQKQERFASRYPESSCPREAVAGYIGVDYTQALQEARGDAEKASAVAREADGDRKVARDAMESFARHRQYPQFTVAGVETLTDEELNARHDDASTGSAENWGRRSAAQAKADEAQGAADKATEDANRLVEYAEGFEQELTPEWRNRLGDYTADLTQFPDISELWTLARAMRRDLKDASQQVTAHTVSVNRLYGQVTKLALDESFVKVDLALAVQLRQNSPEHAAQDRDRLALAITNRTDTLKSDLESLDGDFTRAVSELNGLVKSSLANLERAVNGLKLPDDAPIVGGLPVFKYSTAITRMTQEQRVRILRDFTEELAADAERIPQSGAELAARAILKLAGGHLGIKFLKMTTLVSQQYVDMDKIPHSGGEGIATALFLYFVMMKLRYEVRADSRSAEGMPLLLDNPLGKNTNRQMWQAILHLANSVGMQLLVFTGAQDYEPLSLFKRHVRLAKSKLNPNTKRLHVTISDYQFNYDQAELLA